MAGLRYFQAVVQLPPLPPPPPRFTGGGGTLSWDGCDSESPVVSQGLCLLPPSPTSLPRPKVDVGTYTPLQGGLCSIKCQPLQQNLAGILGVKVIISCPSTAQPP